MSKEGSHTHTHTVVYTHTHTHTHTVVSDDGSSTGWELQV